MFFTRWLIRLVVASLLLWALSGCYHVAIICPDGKSEITGAQMTNILGTRSASCETDPKTGKQTVTLYNSDAETFQTLALALLGALLAAGL